MTSFESLNKDFLFSLAVVGGEFGERPSTLIGWTVEEDTYERLMFDMKCLSELNIGENGKRARKFDFGW